MTSFLRIDRVLGDRPFAEIGAPSLAVADERRELLAVAGTHAYDVAGGAPVGVYGTDDLVCRTLLRSRYRVHALAFHPTLPLLAIGAGRYDGGYFFEGELLLLHLETGEAVSALEGPFGRQVLELEWQDETALRLVMAPPDDWQDEKAHTHGHTAVVTRPDWSAVAPHSLTHDDLAGPRVAAPRPDVGPRARHLLTGLAPDWDPRRHVRAVEPLSDGRILACGDGVRLESWAPSGEREWAVRDGVTGREIVVADDERSAWVASVHRGASYRDVHSVARLSLTDGTRLDQFAPSRPVSLVRRADGAPALTPHGSNGLRSSLPIRRGRRSYFQTEVGTRRAIVRGDGVSWVTAAKLPPPGARPAEPGRGRARQRLFPYSWVPGEIHFGGPGVETADGSLVHAGTVYHGHGLQPGGSFVVRRSLSDGAPDWVFRTDRPATALDADDDAVYAAYDDGEIVALGLGDGEVRGRQHLTVGAVSAVPTALSVAGPGRLIVGTGDGRILLCTTGR